MGEHPRGLFCLVIFCARPFGSFSLSVTQIAGCIVLLSRRVEALYQKNNHNHIRTPPPGGTMLIKTTIQIVEGKNTLVQQATETRIIKGIRILPRRERYTGPVELGPTFGVMEIDGWGSMLIASAKTAVKNLRTAAIELSTIMVISACITIMGIILFVSDEYRHEK
jgi:hypothetical protein